MEKEFSNDYLFNRLGKAEQALLRIDSLYNDGTGASRIVSEYFDQWTPKSAPDSGTCEAKKKCSECGKDVDVLKLDTVVCGECSENL